MRFSKQNGFTLIESLFAVAIFSVSGLAFSSFVSMSADLQSRNKTRLSVSQVKGQVLAMIANKSVWYKNIRDANLAVHPSHSDSKLNPELACLRDGTPCTENQEGYPLTLTDQNGRIVIDGIDTSKGYTYDGAPCTGFTSGTTNPSCPWRLSLRWIPICPASGACVHPQVTINVEVIANSDFLRTTNLTATQLSMLVEQPKVQPPFAKRMTLVTNSIHYGYSSTLTIDPTMSVVSDSPGTLTFTLPSEVSARGGTLELSGNTIIYKPEYASSVSPVPSENIYGLDRFTYTVRDSYTGAESVGTVYVKVMTPYTWTGLAGSGDLSISNKKNFCGKVVNGVCDGETFPSTFLTGQGDMNLVFNEVCTSCGVTIDTAIRPRSIEISSSYVGTIQQQADVVVGSTLCCGSVWKKHNTFLMKAGTWDGQSGTFLVASDSEAGGGWLGVRDPNSTFSVLGGTFKAPPVTLVKGDIYIPSATSFQHQGGTFYWLGTYSNGMFYEGSDSLQFNHLVIGYPKSAFDNYDITVAGWNYRLSDTFDRHYIKNSFAVLGNLTIANTDWESGLNSVNASAVVKVYGDIVIPLYSGGGTVSASGTGFPARVELAGTGDQTIFGQQLDPTERAVTPPLRYEITRVSALPSIYVKKPSGKLIVKDTVAFRGDFVLESADSYVFNNFNLVAMVDGAVFDLKNNTIDEFYYTAGYGGGPVYLASDITVNKLFHWNNNFFWGVPSIYNTDDVMKYIHIKGDAFFGTGASTGNGTNRATTLCFDGTGAQTINSQMLTTRAVSTPFIVNKAGGTATFNGSLGVMTDFFVQTNNVVFGPTFGIHNVVTGADGIRTRLSFSDPVNQVIPTLISNRTIEAMTPVYTKNTTLIAVGGWIGSHYSNLYGGASGSLYVSENLTFMVDPNYFSPGVMMGARSGTQNVILNGTGSQRVEILGSNVTGSNATVDLQVQNTSAHVTLVGEGTIGKLTVGAGAIVDLDSSSVLSLTGVVSGVLNKNGRTPTGSLTTAGAGVIYN